MTAAPTSGSRAPRGGCRRRSTTSGSWTAPITTWRWENEPAEGLTLKDLDRREILRTRELAIQQNRISVDTGRDIGEILDRLRLRVGRRLDAGCPRCSTASNSCPTIPNAC